MSKKRILDISPYKIMDIERKPILDKDGKQLTIKQINPATGVEEEQKAYRQVDIERDYTTEEIKRDYAAILGNSGRNPHNQEFACTGREKYKRNKLGDRIEASETDSVELTNNDYKSLEKAIDEMGGLIPVIHKALLERVFDAPEADSDKAKDDKTEN